ncbi:hypothetical protein [Saccharothrix yanglingensis]|uniref:Uncharacterized protein n=1 Tax=Saccharothrix yanglingensis TaxID=659496 RepID=A0ABU0WUC9_9PSEU|nr:hypothetical protein [Saccharothrix yanglingensis]MDQ2583143.1 hypothetical protein [Saccharothrix yanglingensis]
MEANLFSLVDAADSTRIFAWGMEIMEEDTTTAVVYRRDPVTGRTMLGQHRSAESALARYGRRVPLVLVWEFDEEEPLGNSGPA